MIRKTAEQRRRAQYIKAVLKGVAKDENFIIRMRIKRKVMRSAETKAMIKNGFKPMKDYDN